MFFAALLVCSIVGRLLLLLSFENPSIDGARSLLYFSTAVTTISISPGHVTDILLWPVFPPVPLPPPAAFISYSHGGVGESRRWSKHYYVLIFFYNWYFVSFRNLSGPDRAVIPPEKPKTFRRAVVLLAITMADRGVDLSALPKEVRDQLAELDLELSEGKLATTWWRKRRL